MKVLNFGSLNMDFVYELEQMVRTGETILSKSRNIYPGGKGLNQSVAMARAGVEVFHAGLVGHDGQMLIDVLDKEGVDTSLIRSVPTESTGHAIINVDTEGNNSIVLYAGTNHEVRQPYIKEVLQGFSSGDVIVLQNEVSHLDAIIEEAHAKGMVIFLNPSPFNNQIEECDLAKVDYLILNEIEAEDISGENETAKILDYFQNAFPYLKVVITLGERGSVYKDALRTVTQKAFRVQPIDTTGAGDTFTGYFVASLVQGLDVEEALRNASKAAAIAVTRKGASVSIPSIREIVEAALT